MSEWERRLRPPNGNPWWVDLLILLLLLAIIGVLGAAHGYFAYGDWRCGMPGVHCRKITK